MNWIKVEDQLPTSGEPVVVWCPKNEAMLFWSATSVEVMHNDFRRLGFSHWVNIEPPDSL